MFHPLSGVDAGPSRRVAKEIQFALDTLARLPVHENHRRTRHRSVLFAVLTRRVAVARFIFNFSASPNYTTSILRCYFSQMHLFACCVCSICFHTFV